jgi:hypothetical protein
MDAETMAGDREAWLAARRWRSPCDVLGADADCEDGVHLAGHPAGYRIGSSEVPSILDLDGVGTPVHVWRNKVLGVKEPVNERMQWGHLFEGVIAEEWQRRNRCVVDEIGLIAHVGKPWHQSTIDRRVVECPTVKGLRNGCGLEVKNVGYSSAERWGRDFPDRIIGQVAHQIFVTGYDHMHLAVNIGGNQMRQGIIWRDREEALISYVVGEVDTFRSSYLLTGTEPPWSDSKAAKLIELDKATHPIRAGEASVEDIGWLMEYAEAQARESAAKKTKEEAKAQLARIANGVQVVLFSDRPAWSYRESHAEKVNSAGIDVLKERYPDAYNDPDVVERKTTYTLVVDRAYKVKAKEGEA